MITVISRQSSYRVIHNNWPKLFGFIFCKISQRTALSIIRLCPFDSMIPVTTPWKIKYINILKYIPLRRLRSSNWFKNYSIPLNTKNKFNIIFSDKFDSIRYWISKKKKIDEGYWKKEEKIGIFLLWYQSTRHRDGNKINKCIT